MSVPQRSTGNFCEWGAFNKYLGNGIICILAQGQVHRVPRPLINHQCIRIISRTPPPPPPPPEKNLITRPPGKSSVSLLMSCPPVPPPPPPSHWQMLRANVRFCSFHLSQRFFIYVGKGLPWLNHNLARIDMSCSRTQHIDAGEAIICNPSVSLESSTLPLSHCTHKMKCRFG